MTTNYPVWGESSSAIAPQIYNWAQQDYAQQNANIGRRTDVDRQAIANANNFYQFSRANEMEDARRQQEAASQTYNRQMAFDELQRREAADRMNYEFANKDLAARTAIKTQAEKDREKQNLQAGESQLVADIENGKYPEASHQQLSTMYGVPVARVAVLAEPGRARYEQRALDNLNIRVARDRAKNPKKFDPVAVEGLKVELPASLRNRVYLNRDTFQFKVVPSPWASSPLVQMEQNSYSNPGSGHSPNYSFTAPPEVANTPPPTAAAPIIPASKPLPPEGTFVRQNGVRYQIINGQAVEVR